MQCLDRPGSDVLKEKNRFPARGAIMPPVNPIKASRELCADNKALNGRYCRRCGKPLSGRQKEFCGFGPGSCHTLYYSEARKTGSKLMIPEEHRRDWLLFGKHMTCSDRLNAIVQVAKRILADTKA